ncbi:MAG: hypothetical protein ACNYZG_05320 [Gammaproteobacteria bacterium]
MEKNNHKSLNRKTTSLLDLFKNAKFIFVNLLVLLIIFFALISGDGKKIILNLYQNITGQKYETFTPVDDFSNEAYVILKDKLLRDKDISIEHADVSVFSETDTFYRYRLVLNETVFIYTVEKKQNGLWHIKQEK